MRNSLFLTTERHKVHRHGGREVLRVIYPLLSTQAEAATHLTALVEALCRYAERELLPKAIRVFEGAVQAGEGHSFYPFHYRITLTERERGNMCYVLLETVLTQGGLTLDHRELLTRWSADGSILYPTRSKKSFFARKKRFSCKKTARNGIF